MLWIRGVPAHQAVLPECPDVPDSRDWILRRLRDVVRVRLAGRCRQRQYVVEREDVQVVQPASSSGSRSVFQDVSSDVRLSMTRNARAWRAGMVTVTTFADQHKKQAADLQAQLQQLDTQVGILTKQYAHISADYKKLAALLAQV